MYGGILQDRWGWFFRNNGDGTFDSFGEADHPVKVTTIERPVVVFSNGVVTGRGDPLASRVAALLASRYTRSAQE